VSAEIPTTWKDAVERFTAFPDAHTREALATAYTDHTTRHPTDAHRHLLHYLRMRVTNEPAQRYLVEGSLSNHVIAEHLAPAILVLAEITQNAAPSVQEALKAGEKVHLVSNETPLSHRMAPAGMSHSDKHLLGLFLPYDLTSPLVAIQAQFTQEAPNKELPDLRISHMLTTPPQTLKQPNTCYFYSISNLVMDRSDVPEAVKKTKAYHELIIRSAETLSGHLGEPAPKGLPEGLKPVQNHGIERACTLSPLRSTLQGQEGFAEWMHAHHPEIKTEYLQQSPHAAKAWGLYYLGQEGIKGSNTPNLVAHIHCRNGAEVRGFIPGAEDTEQGKRGAAGLMVSYEYPLDERTRRQNQSVYRTKSVPVSRRAEQEDQLARDHMHGEAGKGLPPIAVTLQENRKRLSA
jgi:hypothetical protein